MKKAIIYLSVALMCLSVFFGCSTSEATVDAGLQNAKNYLFAMYKDKAVVTASDYTVVDTVMISGVSYPVAWSSDVEEKSVSFVSNSNHMVTVDVDEKSPVDVDYTLTGTISDDRGNTLTVTFPHRIPAFKESSWVEYKEAADDSTLVVKGIVTGIMSKTKGNSSNCLYIQDDVGGYYVYAMAQDPLESGIQLGMTVRVTGSKDTYSGTLEIANAAVEILDSSISSYAPADWTEKYEKATSLKDEDLTREQALLVTVKDVEVTGQDTASGYYKFKKNGLESYVRISSSVCPIDKDAQNELKNGHAEHYGWKADVTGVICVYDGAFYLSPVEGYDAFTYVSLPEKSDSEKVSFELDSLTMVDKVVEDTSLSLPLSGAGYDSVSISWSSDSPCAVVDGSTLTFTLPEEETTVTITAKAVSGEEVGEKSFTVIVEAASAYFAYPVMVEEYREHTPYALYTSQNNVGKDLFFNGEISGKYLSTTDKDSKVASVYLEKDGEGWRIYTVKDGSKLYVEIVDGKAALNSEAMGNVWRLDEETRVPVTASGDTDYYLGMYKNYETFSASKTSYIFNDTSVIGVSQFPMMIVEEWPGYYSYDKVSSVSEEGEYILSMDQANVGATLYFNGTISGGKYLGTTRKAEEAVRVKFERDGEGWRIFTTGDEKLYVEIVDGKAALNSEVKGNVWRLDEETGVPVTAVGDTDYYLGSYKSYDTFSASKTSYIFNDTSVIGVSQFPLSIREGEGKKCGIILENVMSVEDGESYYFVVEQNNIASSLFFNGEISGKYLSTSPSLAKGVMVKAEKEGEGFRMVTPDGLYVEIVDGKAALSTEPQGSLWTINAIGVPVAMSGDSEYYLGCYKTYNTFSASKTQYISDVSLIGVSQFPAMLYTVE